MANWTRRRLWKNLVGLALFSAAGYLLLRWLEQHTVFQPSSHLDTTGRELGRPFEEAWLTTGDGVRLHSWFYPAAAGSPRGHFVFLICHGNGGNISHRLGLVRVLLETGAGVLVFDYRGYGRSSGRPSEAGTYRDAEAAHAWLRRRGFAGTNILAYGESLGGAIATELAVRQPLGGLVLQSTFTSSTDMGREIFPWLPVGALARYRFDTLGKLPQVRVPVLVLHGRADTIIPFRHGERLFGAASEPKRFVALAGDHNDQPEADPAAFRVGLEQFLALIEQRPPQHLAPQRELR